MVAAWATGLDEETRLREVRLDRPHPALLSVTKGDFQVIVAPVAIWECMRQVFAPYTDTFAKGVARMLLVGSSKGTALEQAVDFGLVALLPEQPSSDVFYVAIAQALELMEVKARSEHRGKSLNRYRYELAELLEIAQAITTEKEPNKLLDLILRKARFITGADAGSIYVIEGAGQDLSRCFLHFKFSQNDSVSFDSREFTMPISRRSLAGYVALERKTVRIDDVYAMPPGTPYGFDRSYDSRTGYRTRSMLCAPLVSGRGEVIGVLQLINKKREPAIKLIAPEHFEQWVIPFDDRSEELLASLAAQAGISLENALLYAEIRNLFEGFVKASVDAIESRDPTTSGHSRRVAELTVGLARAIEFCTAGPYQGVIWTREELQEIEYASLLHDFGKIGVREQVLVKAKKLYPHELQRIEQRIELMLANLEIDLLTRKLRAVERRASATELEALDAELVVRRAELGEAWQLIIQANEPTVLAEGDFQRIEAVGRTSLSYRNTTSAPLLSADEVAALSIPRGSLTSEEFGEIRSHVTHTKRFLSNIPWGSSLARVPTIAGAHHERLNGTGYPDRLRAEEIPLQSKMMTISDIFDALTASDRPYKRAVPLEQALSILEGEVKIGHVDSHLVHVFVAAKIWEPVLKRPV